MKKILATLLVVVMLAGFATVTAGASSFDSSANELNKLGLLHGTDSGFDLDTAPTRVQAVVMLIRLLGLEEAAKAEGGEHPFTDVPEWADAYIGYAYANGLTNGISETAFGTDNPCNAQMYVTFVLRALGYADGEEGDFTYANALEFGAEAGIVNELFLQGEFLRDQMAAISYLALMAAPKNGDFDTLLASLVEAGAVTQEAADEFTARLALLDEVLKLGSELNDVTKMELGLGIDGSLSMLGQELPVTMTAKVTVIIEDEDIQAAMTADVDAAGEALTIECYIKDGIAYVNAADQKMKIDLGLEEILAAAMSSEQAAVDTASIAIASSLYGDITKETEGDYTVYTVAVNNDLFGAIIAMVAAEVPEAAAMKMSMSPMKYYVDADGALKKLVVGMDMSMTQTVEDAEIPVSISIELVVDILATGDSVKITFPDDLDTYEAPAEEAPAEEAPAA